MKLDPSELKAAKKQANDREPMLTLSELTSLHEQLIREQHRNFMLGLMATEKMTEKMKMIMGGRSDADD